MAAYNRINGEPCVQNKKLISILKDDFGFRGILMSDWGIQGIETVAAAANGLDLEMGTEQPYDNFYFANPLLDSVKAGKTPISVIDDKVRRRLRVQMAIHAMGGPRKPGSRNTPEHSAAARAIAAESIVLLKNTAGLLPLDRAGVKRLLVIGVNATAKHAHEGGSSMIKSNYEITPLAGLQAKLGDAVKIDYLPGYVVVPRNAKAEEKSKAAKDGDRLRTEAVAAAKDADAVLYVGGLNHQFDSEGDDRPDMKLPYAQDTLIADLLAANPKTVVVLVGGSPVEMPWVDRAGSLVWMYYGGQEAGRALADVLLGDANPSGHLPTTFPKRLADSPAHALPGAYADKIVVYKEGLLVGYRWFDKKGIEPLFPFGHGLSYTSFSLSNPQASVSKDGATVSLDVQNTGKRAGAEVVQVYVGQPHCSVERPVRELKGFAKVMLQPGQSKRVEIALPREAFAFWHPQKRAWTVEPGQFVIEIGDSSRSLPCKMTVVVP
jgi:beta-glucosidase